MLRTLHRRAALTVAAAGAALVLGAGSALAAGGWTVVAATPAGQNATLTSVATVSDSDAWAVGYHSGAALSPIGGASAEGVADISPSDAYAIGDSAATAVDSLAANNVWAVGADTPAGSSGRQTLTLNWNGTAWHVVSSPNPSSTDGVGAVATNTGAAIVWAVGESGPAGSFNPLVLQNG